MATLWAEDTPALTARQYCCCRLLTLAVLSVMVHPMLIAPRNKKMVSFALDPALLKGLDEWIARQPVPPSKTAVIEAAIRMFLDADGVRLKGRR